MDFPDCFLIASRKTAPMEQAGTGTTHMSVSACASGWDTPLLGFKMAGSAFVATQLHQRKDSLPKVNATKPAQVTRTSCVELSGE